MEFKKHKTQVEVDQRYGAVHRPLRTVTVTKRYDLHLDAVEAEVLLAQCRVAGFGDDVASWLAAKPEDLHELLTKVSP